MNPRITRREFIKDVLKKSAALAVASEAAASLPAGATRRDIADITAWIKENLGVNVSLHFSRFFPNYQLTDLPATPVETLDMAYDIARSNGLKFIYVGNVPGHEYESTYCPECKTELIHRGSSRDTACRVSILELDRTGSCKKCGHTVPGIWM